MERIKKAMRCISSVSAGTWIRLVMLVLSLLNMMLMGMGVKTIPIDNEEIATAVSGAFAAVSALVAYWKNNSFTEAAQAADKVLHGEAHASQEEEG